MVHVTWMITVYQSCATNHWHNETRRITSRHNWAGSSCRKEWRKTDCINQLRKEKSRQQQIDDKAWRHVWWNLPENIDPASERYQPSQYLLLLWEVLNILENPITNRLGHKWREMTCKCEDSKCEGEYHWWRQTWKRMTATSKTANHIKIWPMTAMNKPKSSIIDPCDCH